ncbi:acyl-CoA dehydrogenase family protein [Sphingoaurantiacus capsulatus]|uniref:Acyl-CoA dehydrogenase family protein n=1 Tax=Sphingoaurantiacus capsulatus TaxID=1771310 RepID=A0ABV7X9N8_9SPHN
MQLELNDADRAFQQEVRDFIAANLTPELRDAGRRMTSVFVEKQWSLAWQRILHAKGWAAPAWPVEFGGPGWTDTQRYIFDAECARAGAPHLSPMGLKMVAPVIMRYGTPEQRAYYLPRILAGEDYWCQGYSEPGAGSDLARLQMRAVSDGDDYVLNGSKIWTTHAHFANRIFCLVRTSTEGKPQQGITFVLVDMDHPGISVEPIITLAGEHEVNQVFFDDVRVPKANRLGEENDGWSVAKYLLEFERGGGAAPGLYAALRRVRAIAAVEGVDDPDFRRRLAEAATVIDAIAMTERRVLGALATGSNPGPISSILKIQATEATQRLDELAVEASGHYAAAQPVVPEPGRNDGSIGPEHAGIAVARYLNNRAASIYGGSNEIQRGIVAKTVLGL